MVVVLAPVSVVSAVRAAMAARLRVPLVAADSGLADGLPDGVITDSFLPSPGAPAKSAAASWIALFSRIRARYLRGEPLSPAVGPPPLRSCSRPRREAEWQGADLAHGSR